MNIKKGVAIGGASLAGAALVAAAGVAGVQSATAAGSHSGNSNAKAQQHVGPPPGARGGPGGGPGPGPGGPGSELLHGQDVVKVNDAIKTFQMQYGDVTAVSSDSITVKSDDGFEATYSINSDTKVGKDGKKSEISAVAVGDEVHLGGEVSGSDITADHIMDGKLPPRPAPPAGAKAGVKAHAKAHAKAHKSSAYRG